MFELAVSEVWPQDHAHAYLSSLASILAQQREAIAELLDLEEGLQFAMLR